MPFKVALLGDIALFGKYSKDREFDPEKYLSGIAEMLGSFDLVVGNLETPMTRRDARHGAKSAYLKASPDSVDVLKYLNVTIVNLANNHIFDYGVGGFRDTIEVLEAGGIGYFGVDGKSILIDAGGSSICLIGFCCASTNPLNLSERFPRSVNLLRPDRIETAIKENSHNGIATIVSLHAGQEHVNYPNRDHILMARKLACAGDYVLYGHHPHVMQGVEAHRGSILAYSLGNFLFDDIVSEKSKKIVVSQTENNKRGYILTLTYDGARVKEWEIVPIYDNGERLVIEGKAEKERIRQLSAEMLNADDAYSKMREELLRKRSELRKSKRDFSWYLERLNLNSLGIILNARRNRRIYRRTVVDYLGR
jgi:poly-gamma-glutamate synthesis protein (capsule biosynthesis protein)